MRPASQPGGKASPVTFSRFAKARCVTLAGLNATSEPVIAIASGKVPQSFGGIHERSQSAINVRYRSLAYIRRIFNEPGAIQLRHCYIWRSLGELNPCFSLERAAS